MAKRDEPTQRLNLVLPIPFIEKLRDVAKERFNAKPHQVTGKVEITQTLIRLIELGLDYVIEQELYEGLEKDETSKPPKQN